MKIRQIFLLWGLLQLACSTAPSRSSPHPTDLGEIEGKKVALIEIEGETTARKVAEVALVNQLTQRGSFILLTKAQQAEADYALQIKVLQFEASVQSGFSSRETLDSQLAEEQGGDGKTEQIFRVKSLKGEVRFLLSFTQLKDSHRLQGLAQASETITQTEETSSIHLPPQLRFLENLSNEAFKNFFEKYLKS